MRKFQALVIFLTAVASCPAMAADDVLSGAHFSITNVAILGLSPSAIQKPSAASYIVITYKLVNDDPNKKMDLAGGIKARLLDDFDNQYRQLQRPDDYKAPVAVMPKTYPSLYPTDSYSETLFFEPPVRNAQKLKLVLDAQGIGMANPVELTVDLANKAALVKVPSEEPQETEKTVRIIDPLKGTILKQGELEHFRVLTTGSQSPSKIIVIGLGATLEDREPAQENVYDVHVPADQPAGTYQVHVIAQWPATADERAQVLSDTLEFDVQEPLPQDI